MVLGVCVGELIGNVYERGARYRGRVVRVFYVVGFFCCCVCGEWVFLRY